MARWLKWIGGTAAGVAVLAGALYLAGEALVNHVYHPSPPEPGYPPSHSPVDSRAQDLDYFRHYLELDKSYTEESRERAIAILSGLEPRLGSLSDGQFQLEIARAVAQANNGHSNIWLGSFSRKHGRIPIRTYWFADGLYVVSAARGHEHLLGARVTGIGDLDFEAASERLRRFVGGTWEAFRAYRGPILFELPVAHYAAGMTGSETETRMRFELAKTGEALALTLTATAIAEDAVLHWPSAYLYATLPGAEGETSSDWPSLAQSIEPVPLYLQQPDLLFRMEQLPQGGLYLQFRANYGEGIDDFQQRVRERLETAPASMLIIDQRFNGGGDYTLTEQLMLDLPELAGTAPLYMITGPATFSAGINSVAFARSTAGERLVLIGERIGDRERMYGETNEFILPNSGLGMTFNTGLHDVENGCPPWPQCYYRNYFSDIAVGKLDPDILVPTGFDDYLEGRDPVLEKIVALHSKQE